MSPEIGLSSFFELQAEQHHDSFHEIKKVTHLFLSITPSAAWVKKCHESDRKFVITCWLMLTKCFTVEKDL